MKTGTPIHTQSERADQTRARILAAAIREFGANGLAGARTEQIAEAAAAAAQARAAKPEAEEAMPAAVGKLFSEYTRARVFILAAFLTASSTRETRAVSSCLA